MVFDRMVKVDSRERVKKGYMGLLKAARRLGLDRKVIQLEAGDILCGKVRGERKVLADFINSFIQHNGAGWDQITRLMQWCDKTGEVPVLGVVAGTAEQQKDAVKTMARYIGGVSVRKAYQVLGEIAIRYPELKILWIPDDMALVQIIFDMAIAVDEELMGKPKTVMLAKYAGIRKKPVQVLCNVFRIPVEEARRVWVYFGSFRRIFMATKSEIARIPKVSSLTAKKLSGK